MENKNQALLILLIATLLLSLSKAHSHNQQYLSIVHGGLNSTKPQVYIVHVQKQNKTRFLRFSDRRSWYTSFLPNTTLDSGEPRMIYAYRHAISGFAAMLTKKEVKAMEAMDGFLQAYPEETLTMHTTYTPEFLGLSQWDGIWPTTGFGGGKVIGVIDTGVKPTHPSFKDDGMAPRPTNWAGKCYWGRPICNNKLIGAVGYRKGKYTSPDDEDGHGTHTASTAAGAFVDDAEVLGSGKGQASGMAPRAHLAIYKVSWKNGNKSSADSSDTLKAIDEAIRDHVDILSMSLGSGPKAFYKDNIAKGSFAAMEEGIVPVAAAGNNGSNFKSMLDNDAPWILTVGASSTDRRMRAVVKLGNGEKFFGESAYQPDTFDIDGLQLPLVYPGVNKTQETLSCQAGSMEGFDVKGKIVLCGTGHTYNTEKGEVVKKAGGAGMIVMNQPWEGNTTHAEAHVIPTSHVSFKDAWDILTYFGSTANPTASITFEGTKVGAPLSPAIADFSSKGPSLINGGIIKPDIVAPGVNVLAAWPFEVGPNPSPTTPTSKTFMFSSGTSMATPHVAGIVALLKNSHPQWSPAAIKSALMTTANVKDREGNPIVNQAGGVATAFDMGSGHIDPVAANDPGLIYDLHYYDYVHYLCGIGYTDEQVSAIIRGTEQCSKVKKIGAEQLNYPSFLVSLTSSSPTVTVTRTVTNVGDAQETYSVDFNEPQHVSMVVTPLTLKFSQVDEQMSYSVTFAIKGNPPAKGLFSEGYLSWVSGKHAVRSPVVATFT